MQEKKENILVEVAMMRFSDKLSVMQQLLNYCSRQECTNMSIHLLRALLLNCEESRLYSDLFAICILSLFISRCSWLRD